MTRFRKYLRARRLSMDVGEDVGVVVATVTQDFGVVSDSDSIEHVICYDN